MASFQRTLARLHRTHEGGTNLTYAHPWPSNSDKEAVYLCPSILPGCIRMHLARSVFETGRCIDHRPLRRRCVACPFFPWWAADTIVLGTQAGQCFFGTCSFAYCKPSRSSSSICQTFAPYSSSTTGSISSNSLHHLRKPLRRVRLISSPKSSWTMHSFGLFTTPRRDQTLHRLRRVIAASLFRRHQPIQAVPSGSRRAFVSVAPPFLCGPVKSFATRECIPLVQRIPLVCLMWTHQVSSVQIRRQTKRILVGRSPALAQANTRKIHRAEGHDSPQSCLWRRAP